MTQAPQPVDLIVYPRWTLPLDTPERVLDDHALVVHEGRLIDVLPADFARQSYRPAQVLEREHHVAMPGLINTHTHAAMALLRGLADDLPLMTWLQQHIWPAEAAHVGRSFCEDGVGLACAEMIRGGQTTFSDMYFFPEVTAAVAREAGLRATLGLIVLEFPSAWAANADDYLRKGLEVHDMVRDDALLSTVFAPHAPYTVSDASFERIRRYANELAIPIHMHVHETAQEVADAQQQTGRRPWQRLTELGIVGPDLIAVHMTQLEDAEIEAAGRSGVSVAHCPESNLKLASGFCPVHRLQQAGVNVALGTDGAASNNDLDLWGEMRTAALLGKAVAGDAAALPAGRVLQMATVGGARALGLERETGTLQPGKAADFILVDVSGLDFQPVYHLASQLVYCGSRHLVTDTFVAGRALMRDRQLLTLDEAELAQRAAAWRERIRPVAG